MRRLCLGLVLAGVVATVTPRAIERDINDTAIDEALAIARNPRDEARIAFHREYVFQSGSDPVTSVSLVTEFRRVVIAAEDQLRFGNRMWGLREAREVVRAARNTMTIVADINFHPQNAYVTVPSYDIRIVPKEGPELRAASTKSTARYGLQSVPTPSSPPYYPFPSHSLPIGPGADPLLGAWIEATFDVAALDPRALVVVAVSEGGRDLATIPVDLARVR